MSAATAWDRANRLMDAYADGGCACGHHYNRPKDPLSIWAFFYAEPIYQAFSIAASIALDGIRCEDLP